ncbi:maleylpyruvate isomerase N-terminal domain-containing protein [Streptomyces longwoodensis]|uniref:Maleylpyruvate isomerase family protein n=1 Tax=Streptomyces lasalocidi TaxID=324833 RepID=A0A4U5WQ04_STRLS|nr:maleylpyruvate isomerase N-terminal domain-containing protein [Streptomyces lasalocidi]TKT04368.1 maleylpyruvate isomerase family protein [Streptomyces lasalocidi]
MTTPPHPRSGAAGALRAAYQGFAAVVGGLGDEESWAPSGCTGWAVRDLVFHCVGDARRALVALHTPAEGPPDRDAVTYWRDWGDDPVGAADGRRFDRVAASMFLDFRQLRALYLETAAATVRATAATPSDRCVATQGHVLTVGDLMATLAVEAAVHHLDLVVHLPDAPRPAPAALTTVRATLDGLLGRPAPVEWTDEHYARVGTGRAPLTDAERAALGADADRFPLFS